MFLKLSDNAKIALDKVVQRFKAGDIGPLVKVVQMRLQLPADAPARKWTISNQVLAYATTGSVDVRGYRQWQQAGRQVQGGTEGGYILGPIKRTKEDEETGEKYQIVVGYTSISVHPITNTEGDPIADYELPDPPPLVEVARRLGVTVTWQPLPEDRLGDYDPSEDHINVGTTDPQTFFHELSHAAHKRVKGSLHAGQRDQQEAVAALAATVLMHLYGLGDRTGNCWHYIKGYADSALLAITAASSDVGKILDIIFADEEGEQSGTLGSKDLSPVC